MTVIPFPKTPALRDDERRTMLIFETVVGALGTGPLTLGMASDDPEIVGQAVASGLLMAAWVAYRQHLQRDDVRPIMMDEIERLARIASLRT
jgi:hypothetical protein